MVIDTDLPLRGKVAVLAGATGAVGSALLARLLSGGASVAAVVRKPWQVAKVSEAVPVADRARCLVGCAPPGDSEAIAGFVKGAGDALGPLDALLCAAGTFRPAPFGREEAAAFAEQIEANYLAPALLARAVVPPMRRRRAGALVFVGADAVGVPGGSGMAGYLASKAALHEMVRVLAVELAEAGIRVAAVLPGIVDTEANRRAMPQADPRDWLPLGRVVDAMLRAAFGPPPAGPLLAVDR